MKIFIFRMGIKSKRMENRNINKLGREVKICLKMILMKKARKFKVINKENLSLCDLNLRFLINYILIKLNYFNIFLMKNILI